MESNLNLNQVYFKGSGIPNGIPAYNPSTGIFTLGGFQSASDLGGQAYFGYLMSSNPLDTDGAMFVGIPSGYIPRGVVLYDGGVAMNDAAKPNYILQGAPITVAYYGTVWFYSWNKTAPGSIDPVIGAYLIANITTGEIEFVPNGTTTAMVPTGWKLISDSSHTVKSLLDDKSAAMAFIKI